jgi:hypothetical protein
MSYNLQALECLDHYIDINRKTEQHFIKTKTRSGYTTGDKYIDNVHLYHNIDRRYEGFIFLLEDYFLGKDSLTYDIHKLSPDPEWGYLEYLYLIFSHRIFGSGTSNEFNHGYHNSRLLEFKNFSSWSSFHSWLQKDDENFVSCRVNQPPRYPLKNLVGSHFLPWVNHIQDNIKPNMSIKQIVDVMNSYNLANGLHRFNFHYLLMAADLANYTNLNTKINGLFSIDEWSDCYLGPSSTMAMKLLKPNYKHKDFLILCERYNMKPMDLEDLLCVWWKYIHNPIWSYYIKDSHTASDFDNGWNIVEKHKTFHKYQSILKEKHGI